jgi:hypothetical protein
LLLFELAACLIPFTAVDPLALGKARTLRDLFSKHNNLAVNTQAERLLHTHTKEKETWKIAVCHLDV